MKITICVIVFVVICQEVIPETIRDVVQTLQTTVEAMEQTMTKHAEGLKQANETIQELKEENRRLKSQIAVNDESCKNRMIELADNTSHLVAVFRGMSAQTTMLAHQANSTAYEGKQLQEQQIANLRSKQEAQKLWIQSEIASLKAQNIIVGFTAVRTNTQWLNGGDTAIYNVAPDNYPAGSYNVNTGKFTCPVSGLYFFGIATFSLHDHVHIMLIKNDGGYITSFADRADNDQGANFWIVMCNRGESVWGKMTNPRGGSIEPGRYDGEYKSSFVGFLIRKSE